MKTPIERLNEIADFIYDEGHLDTVTDIRAIIHDLTHPWIKTGDRLPEPAVFMERGPEGFVRVYDKVENTQYDAGLHEGFWWNNDYNQIPMDHITHWHFLNEDPE